MLVLFSLVWQTVQLQPALCPVEETAPPTAAPPEAQELSSPAPPHPVLLSPSHLLQSSPGAGERVAVCDGPALLSMGQLVSVASAAEGGITQFLLEDGQAIPVQVVDPTSISEFMGA